MTQATNTARVQPTTQSQPTMRNQHTAQSQSAVQSQPTAQSQPATRNQPTARNITILPVQPRVNAQRSSAPAAITKKRVCAYCRVSTDMDEQLESYEAQMKYYTDYIQNRPDWTFCGIFADEGISGTSVKKRVEFMKMIKCCKAGEIDMVITKSISRFARNTLDCLNYVRQLREKGIAVLFEKENIDTSDAKGEVLLTILSSLAQDESRNISENTRWGIQQRFREGRVWVGGHMLGYNTERGQITINEEEAVTVRRIFRECIEGKSTVMIARGLMADHILTGAGKPNWTIKGILTILKNEKYTGDALLQKTYTADFLTHKQVVNRGEMQQIYVEGSHEAIIPKELFDRVQLELARRARGAKPAVKSVKFPFSGRMVCPDCGSFFTRRIWDSDDPRYKRAVWQCSKKYDRNVDGQKGARCASGHIAEKKLIEITNSVMEQVLTNRDEVIQTLRQSLETTLTLKHNPHRDELPAEIQAVKEKMNALITGNDMRPESQDGYSEEYARLTVELDALMKEQTEYDTAEFKMNARRENALALIDALSTGIVPRVVEKPDEREEKIQVVTKVEDNPEDGKYRGKRKRMDLSAIPFPDCHFPYEDMNEQLFALMIERILFYNEKHIDFELKDGSTVEYEG